MRSIAEIKDPGNALTIDLLLNDTQIAMSFLDLAELPSASDEDRERRHQEAARAYNTILKFLARTMLSEEQYEALMTRLNVLRARLENHAATHRKVA
jgi:hypothetical protein